ncbi:CbiX/SirB N-terminal domain-containing protein [Novispirillum itersonii]|uniref:Sirohydrochlorin cobaltochelatase n=1 Tax=Novispirillum itersonii TaxID=189 RepID=A0A7W9ZCG7_NOVIT|nr:CbiX/SirB N-terminal domain-containing protein [Novispirillum itersonii]MBB6208840.1 sirohydrochlorin cobaltochelatase [Novispirillum itersonii]
MTDLHHGVPGEGGCSVPSGTDRQGRLQALCTVEDAPALLLVGHGSARTERARLPTLALAERLRQRGPWCTVAVAFWKEPPFIREALAALTAPRVIVVPNFASDGIFTREKIPAELAAAGYPGQVILTGAIGAHPLVEQIMVRRIDAALARIRAAGWPPDQVTVLLVGHGSRRPGGSSTTITQLADRLAAAVHGPRVHACFIEEAPLVTDWRELTASPVVIVMPMLIAEGMHGSEDVPPQFGLTAEDVAPSAPDLTGPVACGDRQVWYWRGIGSSPDLIDIIEDMAFPHLTR